MVFVVNGRGFMMYVTCNPKTKKELLERFKNGELLTVFQPGLSPRQTDGEVSLEGPHYSKAHTWYARAEIKGSVIIKILS